MQPTATTAWVRPWSLRSLASSRASTESFLAASTNPQVLTTATSASEASSTRSQPIRCQAACQLLRVHLVTGAAKSDKGDGTAFGHGLKTTLSRRPPCRCRLPAPAAVTPRSRARGGNCRRAPGTEPGARRDAAGNRGGGSAGLGVTPGVGEPFDLVQLEAVLHLLAVDEEVDRAGVAEDEIDALLVLEGLGLALSSSPSKSRRPLWSLTETQLLSLSALSLTVTLSRGRRRWRSRRARAWGLRASWWSAWPRSCRAWSPPRPGRCWWVRPRR